MRLGYNWRFGPFELIDQLGTGWFADRLRAEGRPVPELLRLAQGRPFYRVRDGRLEQLGADGGYLPVQRPDGVLLLADVKRAAAPLLRNGSAALWDIGDGVACFEFTSKMNALDADTLEPAGQIDRARGRTAPRHGGLQRGRELLGRRQSRPCPVRAQCRPVGPDRGAGRQGPAGLPRAEVCAVPDRRAHRRAWRSAAAARSCCTAPRSRPHAETYMGLVETGVGIVPAWGGCKEMLLRHMADRRRPGGPMPPISKAFELISLATVAKSAADAKRLLYLRPDDGITMNRDRLLADAKAKALALAEGYRPPAPPRRDQPARPDREGGARPGRPRLRPARQGHGARSGRGRRLGRGALRRRRRRHHPAAGRGRSAGARAPRRSCG